MRFNRPEVAYAHDIVMAALSFVLSLWLRMGGSITTVPIEAIALGTVIFTVGAATVFRFVGLYKGVWRYASVNDLKQITKAVTLSILVFLPIIFIATRAEYVPRSLPIINWLVLLILLGGPRFAYRLFKDGGLDLSPEANPRPRIPVLLVGAGDEAETFIRAMTRHHDVAYRVVGVLDDKGGRVGRSIHQVPVLGGLDQLETIVGSLSAAGRAPQRLIITKPEIEGPRIRDMLDRADKLGLALSRLPRLTDFQAGQDPIEVKPIALEDLLGRPQTVLDRAAMQRLIEGRHVLVTGAGGTIGGELCRQIAALNPKHICILDSSERGLYETTQELTSLDVASLSPVLVDIRDRSRLNEVFAQQKPELVFHAAALKHVPIVEDHGVEGILTNIIGTRNVADAAVSFSTRAMVLISTDKAVNPTSIMGATKRTAEGYCQALDLHERWRSSAGAAATRFITVRFGNVLGSTGSVVPLFQSQLAAGGPITVTDPDMTRYFMTKREAVELVLQASALGLTDDNEAGHIYVLDMGEPVSIVDLARQMIRLAGKQPDKDIQIVFTGARPGERLNEQLFHDSEHLQPTSVEGILLANPRTTDLQLLTRTLDELRSAATAGEDQRCLDLLRRLVPEYTPHHESPPKTALAV